MKGRIQIIIKPDGTIVSKTIGIKGKKCLKYMKKLEHLTNGKIIDSEFTSDFFEEEHLKRNFTKEEMYEQDS